MDLNVLNDDRAIDNDALSGTLQESQLYEIFELSRIIVQDASGVLYEAKKTLKGKRIAVALLSPGFSVLSKRLSLVEHANICKMHQIIQRVDGTEAIVMDLPLGVPLNTLLESGTIFSINQTISVLLQLLSAMHAVHKQEETLLNLTENNIFIAEDSKGSLHLKLIGCCVGASGMDFRSPYYLSPEQIVDGNMRSHKSDLWAAGAVFYHLLFGHPPFEGEHTYDVAQKVMLEDPSYEDEIRQIPPLVLDVLRKFLNKDTEQRFQSVSEAVAKLLPLRAEFSDTAMPPQFPNLAYAATDPPDSPLPNAVDPHPFDDDIDAASMFDDEDVVMHRQSMDDDTSDDDTTQNIEIESSVDAGSPALDQTIYATDTDEFPSSDFIEDNFIAPTAAADRQNILEDASEETGEQEHDTHKTMTDLETLVNKEKSLEAMSQTKIDDLAQANRDAPLSIDAIAQKLKQTSVPKSAPKPAPPLSPPKKASWLSEFIAEQPKLFTALVVFTIATISFAVLLVLLLQNQGIRGYQPRPGTLNETVAPQPPAEENRPATHKHSNPPPVVIDLLRLPAGATVLLNDEPTQVPIRVPRSKAAIKLTVEAKGFTSFERLIVPDRDRKIMVEMPRRPRKDR